MINNEYKNSSEVYKVQTFRTTQLILTTAIIINQNKNTNEKGV